MKAFFCGINCNVVVASILCRSVRHLCVIVLFCKRTLVESYLTPKMMALWMHEPYVATYNSITHKKTSRENNPNDFDVLQVQSYSAYFVTPPRMNTHLSKISNCLGRHYGNEYATIFKKNECSLLCMWVDSYIHDTQFATKLPNNA